MSALTRMYASTFVRSPKDMAAIVVATAQHTNWGVFLVDKNLVCVVTTQHERERERERERENVCICLFHYTCKNHSAQALNDRAVIERAVLFLVTRAHRPQNK
jgi:hypothetical protein